MCFLKDWTSFKFRYVSLQYLIIAHFILVPRDDRKVFHAHQQFLILLDGVFLQCSFCCQKVDYIFEVSSVTCTIKICMLGNLPSKLVGFLSVSICDKWSGPAFKHLGSTTTSKSYSWNNKSHLHRCPPAQAYWQSTLAQNGLYTFWNVLLANSASIFGAHTPSRTARAWLWNSSSQPWKIYDLQMQ